MRPEITVEERHDGTRVCVQVGDAGVWVRATPGGRRLDVWIDEGNGSVFVDWGIRRRSGEYVQPAVLSRGTEPESA